MGEWYSLEGLAARLGLADSLSYVRERLKVAFKRTLAVTGREGEVNDHFDGPALISREAAIQFIVLKWTGKMGVCSLLTLAPDVAPVVSERVDADVPLVEGLYAADAVDDLYEHQLLERPARAQPPAPQDGAGAGAEPHAVAPLHHVADARVPSDAVGAPCGAAGEPCAVDLYRTEAVERLIAIDGRVGDPYCMGGDLLMKSDLKYNTGIRTLVAGVKNVTIQQKLREALDKSPLPRDLHLLAMRLVDDIGLAFETADASDTMSRHHTNAVVFLKQQLRIFQSCDATTAPPPRQYAIVANPVERMKTWLTEWALFDSYFYGCGNDGTALTGRMYVDYHAGFFACCQRLEVLGLGRGERPGYTLATFARRVAFAFGPISDWSGVMWQELWNIMPDFKDDLRGFRPPEYPVSDLFDELARDGDRCFVEQQPQLLSMFTCVENSTYCGRKVDG